MSTNFFRHPRTGQIGEYSPALADRFGLVAVGKDAKPLAFTPIPEAKVTAVKSSKEADRG
jgi:hypothetical protein